VGVVDREQERRAAAELLEQRLDRAMGAVALTLERRPELRLGAQCREDPSQLRELVAPKAHEPGAGVGSEVVIERVDEGRERRVALELGRPPGEDQIVALVAESEQLLEKRRLADPRLSDQLEDRCVHGVLYRVRDRRKLPLPPHERGAPLFRALPLARRCLFPGHAASRSCGRRQRK
jgi:hypothetical protein